MVVQIRGYNCNRVPITLLKIADLMLPEIGLESN